MKQPSSRIAAAVEKIAAHQRSMTPAERAAEAAEFELDKAAMLAAAETFDLDNPFPCLIEEPTV